MRIVMLGIVRLNVVMMSVVAPESFITIYESRPLIRKDKKIDNIEHFVFTKTYYDKIIDSFYAEVP